MWKAAELNSVEDERQNVKSRKVQEAKLGKANFWVFPFLPVFLNLCFYIVPNLDFFEAEILTISLSYIFQKDDITNCFTRSHTIFGYLELSLLKGLFICLFSCHNSSTFAFFTGLSSHRGIRPFSWGGLFPCFVEPLWAWQRQCTQQWASRTDLSYCCICGGC